MDMPTCRCGAKLLKFTEMPGMVTHWVCEVCSHSNWACTCLTKEEISMQKEQLNTQSMFWWQEAFKMWLERLALTN